MAEIRDYYLYDISELLTTWDTAGWQGLAAIGEAVGARGGTFGNRGVCVSRRIRHGLEDILQDFSQKVRASLPQPYEMIALSLIPHNRPFPTERRNKKKWDALRYYKRWQERDKGGSDEDDARRIVAMKEVLKAFSASATIGQAFEQISTARHRKKFLQYERHYKPSFPVSIGAFWREAIGYLLNGVEGLEACEEAYWNCVWLYAKGTIARLQKIMQRIEDDVPVENEEFEELNELLSWGEPDGGFIDDGCGRLSYAVSLQPVIPALCGSGLASCGTVLCVRPAFVIAKKLESMTSKGRFIIKCRAPSCGKRFYTGYADATNCPGSRGGKKNRCSLDWIRYKRYLKKIGKDPESDWDNEQLREAFIAYAKS